MIINKFQIKLLKITMFINIFYSISCTVKQHNKDEKPEDYYVEQNYKSLEQKNIENEIEKYNQVIFSDLIKSVQIGTKSISTGEPCYSLGSNDNISIDFDILNGNIESLQYEIIHCNKNWEKSNLMEMEYIEGFAINFIENNEISHGPIQQYIHYNFEVPNENLNFIKSGNYIILIYDYELNEPVATKRFMVYENILDIKSIVKKSNLAKNRFDKQIVEFTVQNHFQN